MLTQGEDVEAHALRQRGRTISAIARHLERDLIGPRKRNDAGVKSAKVHCGMMPEWGGSRPPRWS